MVLQCGGAADLHGLIGSLDDDPHFPHRPGASENHDDTARYAFVLEILQHTAVADHKPNHR